MSRFQSIPSTIWNDDRFPFLGDDCQLLLFHVMTTPMGTSLGLFKASLAALADEKRWPLDRYQRAFAEAEAAGFAHYDPRALVIYLPGVVTRNPPHNPNILKYWGNVFHEIPSSPLKTQCWTEIARVIEPLRSSFQKSFTESFQEPFRNDSPNIEVEVEGEGEGEVKGEAQHILLGSEISEPSAPQSDAGIHVVPFEKNRGRKKNGPTTREIDEFITGWNEVCASEGLPYKEHPTQALRDKIRLRLREHLDPAFWQQVFNTVRRSDFLCGRKPSSDRDTPWKASLGWLVKNSENAVKVYEGEYGGLLQRARRPGIAAPRRPEAAAGPGQ